LRKVRSGNLPSKGEGFLFLADYPEPVIDSPAIETDIPHEMINRIRV
jgi:hypothetical protein